MKPVICPVCNGKGTITQYPEPQGTSDSTWENTCHGCGGKGEVEVYSEVVNG